MGVMEEAFSNKTLNTMDRLLVLDEKDILKNNEIKRLTRATSVRELKNTYSEDLDSFICNLITRALLCRNPRTFPETKVYVVKGAGVSSEMLTLKVTPVATLLLTADRIKKLHNACLTKQKLDDLLFRLKQVKELHDDAVEFYKQRKIQTTLPAKTSQIKKVFQDYAKEEMESEMAVINDVMKNRW
jgi:Trp operon repressor